MASFTFTLLNIVLVTVLCGANIVPQSTTEADVIRDLLSRDVKYGIPENDGVLMVMIGLYVEAVTEVDVERGTVEIVGFLSLQWHDPRLRFEHSDPFHEVKDARVPRDAVWTPDIELYTQVAPGVKIMNTARDQVLVEFNGTVKWYPMVALKTLCADLASNKTEVTCSLKFGSWTYSARLLDVAVSHPMGVLSQYRSTGLWTVSDVHADRVATKYDCCPDTYVFANYNLTLTKRKI